jgi:hypothetical protein
MIPSAAVTVAVLNIPLAMNTMNTGIIKSNTVTSLENRVTILPTGFESKKRIVALITLFDTELCRFVVDTAIIQNAIKDLNKQHST